jgi:hypothetical protein
MCNRHQCHNPSLCVTCADHADRHQRHTPLEGVTIVTLVDKVSMHSFYCGWRCAGGGYAFALCSSRLTKIIAEGSNECRSTNSKNQLAHSVGIKPDNHLKEVVIFKPGKHKDTSSNEQKRCCERDAEQEHEYEKNQSKLGNTPHLNNIPKFLNRSNWVLAGRDPPKQSGFSKRWQSQRVLSRVSSSKPVSPVFKVLWWWRADRWDAFRHIIAQRQNSGRNAWLAMTQSKPSAALTAPLRAKGAEYPPLRSNDPQQRSTTNIPRLVPGSHPDRLH